MAVAVESCRCAVGGGRVAGWLGMGTELRQGGGDLRGDLEASVK